MGLMKRLSLVLILFGLISSVPKKALAGQLGEDIICCGFGNESEEDDSDEDDDDDYDDTAWELPAQPQLKQMQQQQGSFIGRCKYIGNSNAHSAPTGCDKSSFQVRSVACESPAGGVTFVATGLVSGPKLSANKFAAQQMAKLATKPKSKSKKVPAKEKSGQI